MRRVMLDKELAEKMKEAASILGDYRKSLEKQIPEQWEIRTLMFPVQYQKVVEVGKNRYMGYLRSRWGNPFSIAIYELEKRGKWRGLAFEHKPVDEAENNPPLKSIKIIESQFAKMKRVKKRQTILEVRI